MILSRIWLCLTVVVALWPLSAARAAPDEAIVKALTDLWRSAREKQARAVAGTEAAKISPEAVRELVEKNQRMERLSLDDASKLQVTDLPAHAWACADDAAQISAVHRMAGLQGEATESAGRISQDEGLDEKCAKKVYGALLETMCKRLLKKATGDHASSIPLAEPLADQSADALVSCVSTEAGRRIVNKVDARAGEMAQNVIEAVLDKAKNGASPDASAEAGASADTRGRNQLLLIVNLLCESVG